MNESSQPDSRCSIASVCVGECDFLVTIVRTSVIQMVLPTRHSGTIGSVAEFRVVRTFASCSQKFLGPSASDFINPLPSFVLFVALPLRSSHRQPNSFQFRPPTLHCVVSLRSIFILSESADQGATSLGNNQT